ncbi:MAG: diaminopimelate epimerase [Prevotellaceae bacterium]|nr:diaminopimelate epimerase [Prevotellaceae bacterium]
MNIPFIKMHGAGNDYIYIDGFKTSVQKPVVLAREISNRHTGIGSDGLVIIHPSTVAHCRMQMFNADGSEGQMCGNAIRCVGKFMYEYGYCSQTTLTVETLSGIKTLRLTVDNGIVKFVEVEMGQANFTAAALPMLTDAPIWKNQPLAIGDETFHITAVSMGNPHIVIFCDDIDAVPLALWGSRLEHHPLFPQRVNVGFAQIVSSSALRLRVWERGSGETLACGTGACAAVAAAVTNAYLTADTQIRVEVRGGELLITCAADFSIIMKGAAALIAEGIYFQKTN